MSHGHHICAAAHLADHLPPLLLLRSAEQALCPHPWRSRPQNRGRLGGRASDAWPASTARGVGSCASKALTTPTHEFVMHGLCLSAVSSG
ncbi:hypothetical protein GGG16DRAFT_125114 [Schizophyllum commune]